jgi:deazaflavin-dependent oxidoreductase (nitroreductase family)
MKPDQAFHRPTRSEEFLNRLFGLMVGWGFGLKHNYLLQVQGRKTGRIYATPVNMLDYKGTLFLVAPRGETQWVRNARASGQVWLKRGRTRKSFTLRALNADEKPEIIREYLNRYKGTVQRYFPVPAEAPLKDFVPIAANYPAFELLPQ